VTTAALGPAAPDGSASRSRRWRRPGLLQLASAGVVVVVTSPLVFLAVEASQAGWGEARRLLGRPLIVTLMWHTVTLTLAVTLGAVVLGFVAGYLVERTDLPGRRVWIVVLTLPLAVPEFVHGYSWVSLMPGVQGYWGAVLVMTSSLYPLVFLPVAATLHRSDIGAEEVSRSLGHGPWVTLWRVTIPLTRPALAGGALLVSLYLLGEYGAFAMLRFTTFATAIYTQFKLGFDAVSGALLTVVLCGLALVVVAMDALTGRRGRVSREGDVGRRQDPVRLGRWRFPAAVVLTAMSGVALGVPAFALVFWLIKGSSTTLPPASIWQAAAATLGYSLAAAAVATAAAVPVALYGWRHRSRWARAAEHGAYLTRALPGIAVALSVVFFAVRYAPAIYQQPPLLVAAYVILFFPLALTGVRSALAQVPPGVEEVARSLGVGPLSVLARVTLPLIVPGLGAAAAMVALTASTELTATLLLHPTGTQTLATVFWSYTTGLAYGAAAPYAALMIILTVPAVLILTRRTLGDTVTGSRP
jgi:iron(III) transport system permease protein